jgi:hypothetical protein
LDCEPEIEMMADNDIVRFLNLPRLEAAYQSSKSRDRAGIYIYLAAVYQAARRVRKAGHKPDDVLDALADIEPQSSRRTVVKRLIDLSCDAPAAYRSKWARALSWCLKEEVSVTKAGIEGHTINGCADRYSKMRARSKR